MSSIPNCLVHFSSRHTLARVSSGHLALLAKPPVPPVPQPALPGLQASHILQYIHSTPILLYITFLNTLTLTISEVSRFSATLKIILPSGSSRDHGRACASMNALKYDNAGLIARPARVLRWPGKCRCAPSLIMSASGPRNAQKFCL